MSTYPGVPWGSEQGGFAWKSWFQRLQNYLQDGVYTPTLTNVTNIDSTAPLECHFMRIGETAIVGGRINVNATAAAATEVGISLPLTIPSKFVASEDCAGVGVTGDVSGESARIIADTTNNRARMLWTASNTNNNSWTILFIYQIIG